MRGFCPKVFFVPEWFCRRGFCPRGFVLEGFCPTPIFNKAGTFGFETFVVLKITTFTTNLHLIVTIYIFDRKTWRQVPQAVSNSSVGVF